MIFLVVAKAVENISINVFNLYFTINLLTENPKIISMKLDSTDDKINKPIIRLCCSSVCMVI